VVRGSYNSAVLIVEECFAYAKGACITPTQIYGLIYGNLSHRMGSTAVVYILAYAVPLDK
jgi:hypothetical protein